LIKHPKLTFAYTSLRAYVNFNANPYFGVLLTEQETEDILTTGTLMIHLGTVDEKSHANIHPAWYYYDPFTNKLYIQTGKQSKKTYNLIETTK
jgi:hypothetical protein